MFIYDSLPIFLPNKKTMNENSIRAIMLLLAEVLISNVCYIVHAILDHNIQKRVYVRNRTVSC